MLRNHFRAATDASGTNDWIAQRVPGMSPFDCFCMSQPATNFAREDVVPALPLALFAGNGLVEAQLNQPSFTLKDYPSEVITAYAAVALRAYAKEHGLETTVDHNALPPPLSFAAFFDLVAHGPHVAAVQELLGSWMLTLRDDELSELKNAVTTALGANNMHTLRFYEFFRTFQKVTRLVDLVTGLSTIDDVPDVSVPYAMAAQLRGASVVGLAKGIYSSDPMYGYLLQPLNNGPVLRLTCFDTRNENVFDPLTPLPTEQMTLEVVDDDDRPP